MTPDLNERIAAALAEGVGAAQIAPVLADARAEGDRLRAEHDRLEGDALDPLTKDAAIVTLRAQCADIGFDIRRVTIAIERLAAAQEAAQAREAAEARQAAYDAAQDELSAAGAALEGEGRKLVAQLRAMIARGNAAWNAALATNRNLPEGSIPIAHNGTCGRVPERIISVRDVQAYFLDKEHIPETRLAPTPVGAEHAFVVGLNGVKATLEPARRIEVVPAHDIDWLGGTLPPAPVARFERIVVPHPFALQPVKNIEPSSLTKEERLRNAEAERAEMTRYFAAGDASRQHEIARG